MFTSSRYELLLSSAASAMALVVAVGAASAQQPEQQPSAAPQPGGTPIPQINVTAPKPTPRRTAAPRRTGQPTTTQPAAAPLTPEQAEVKANEQVIKQTETLDVKRDEVLQPKTGTNVTTLSQRDIENVPQGSNVAVSDLVYQFPGVSQDSTSSGDFHVRNDHANVQYRINGIQMPDGVSGFSQFLETNLFSRFSLITGALPAQYGLHTTGVLDITTKSGEALSGGSVSVYGGSYGTISPSFEYGGVKGNTEYYVTGRLYESNLGLENPTSSTEAHHDHTDLGRFFSYTSTLLDPNTRFVTFAGVSDQSYQIPTNPGQTPSSSVQTAYGATASNFSSSQINQNQYEKNEFFVGALQRSVGDVDAQISYFNRYSELHFVPDQVGDLLYNGVATDVLRRTFVNGIQADLAYKLNDQHTLRTGLIGQVEQSKFATVSTAEQTDSAGNVLNPLNPTYVTATDSSSLTGYQLGLYAQDEWKILPTVTLNYGLRFDQMWQYVDTNQVSPRASVQWQPWWSTIVHVGYSRNFTPPDQVLGRPAQTQLLANTTGFPYGTSINGSGLNYGSIEPERADVYDVGIVQQLLPQCPTPSGGMPTKASPPAKNCPALEVGVDAYYKYAHDLIDDGQFGQAYLLSAFNYDQGIVEGIEFKAKYTQGNFTFYTNWSPGWEKANTVASNQSFFSQSDYNYILSHWVYTDHTQMLTGSAGISYLFGNTGKWWLDDSKISSTMVYGGGLRANGTITLPDGTFANCPNCDHVPAYTQVNLGLSHEFKDTGWDPKPFTVRFDIVNLFDTSYVIRNGTGIGVFAPQYGPRRGFFVGFTQKL
jgi:outer membrane receptor protein involved in Fe transport